MKVYFFSGLGADRSVFRHIQLPEGYEAVYLDWIKPLKDESLTDYAIRLAAPIDTSGPFSIIGLSMGGMMAVEVAKRTRPAHLILISSISCSAHLPPYYRWLGALKLHKYVPISVFQKGSLLKRMFTTESKEDKIILKQMIRNTDTSFIRWAMGAILSWNCTDADLPVIHIHGTRDGILPKHFTRPTHLIPKAGHLMVVNRASEINAIIANVLQDSRQSW